MPNKKGTGLAQTPKKAKRIIKIKRKTSKVVTAKKPTKKLHDKKKSLRTGIYSFTGSDGKEHTFTAIELKFADLCVGLDKSPLECVVEAGYNVYDKAGKLQKGVAWSIASQNLNKLKFREYINKQLESVKLNESVAMLELAQLLLQKFDRGSKLKALDMYFKVKGSYKDNLDTERSQEISKALDVIASLVK